MLKLYSTRRCGLREAIRIRRGPEGGALMTGIGALIRVVRKLASADFLPCKEELSPPPAVTP